MFGNEMMHGRVPDKPHAWHATTDTILTLLHLPDTILSLATFFQLDTSSGLRITVNQDIFHCKENRKV